MDGLKIFQSPKEFFIAIGWSVCIFSIAGINFTLILNSINFSHEIPWYAGLMLLVFVCFAVSVLSSPGNIGVYEYVCVLGLTMFSIAKEEAIMAALLLHFVPYCTTLVAGLIFFWRRNLSIRKVCRAAAEERMPFENSYE